MNSRIYPTVTGKGRAPFGQQLREGQRDRQDHPLRGGQRDRQGQPLREGQKGTSGNPTNQHGRKCGRKDSPHTKLSLESLGLGLAKHSAEGLQEGKTKTLRSTDRVYFECTKQILVRYKPY